MDWSQTRVLVTGAGGFIGSHLCERLVTLGAKTRALVRYNSANAWGCLEQSPLKEQIEVVLGDVRDRDSLTPAMADVDVVFHLAALIGIPYSYHAPRSYVQTNVEGTLNVLQAALDAGARRIVHTSTSEVYGTAQYVPINEAHPLQGQSPYAASKIGADKMVEAFHRSFDAPVVTLRPFNTFGPRQSARAVIPTIIAQAMTGAKIRLGNVAPRRDLNYVENTVEGYVRAADAPGVVGRTLNLGSGREISIGDLAALIADLMDVPLEVEQEADRVRPPGSEVEQLLADAGEARRLLGWEPLISLEDGLQRTIEWMRAHPEGYRAQAYVV
jgi:dTDP-glucose 4,6-dehydratase